IHIRAILRAFVGLEHRPLEKPTVTFGEGLEPALNCGGKHVHGQVQVVSQVPELGDTAKTVSREWLRKAALMIGEQRLDQFHATLPQPRTRVLDEKVLQCSLSRL